MLQTLTTIVIWLWRLQRVMVNVKPGWFVLHDLLLWSISSGHMLSSLTLFPCDIDWRRNRIVKLNETCLQVEVLLGFYESPVGNKGVTCPPLWLCILSYACLLVGKWFFSIALPWLCDRYVISECGGAHAYLMWLPCSRPATHRILIKLQLTGRSCLSLQLIDNWMTAINCSNGICLIISDIICCFTEV